VQLDAGRAHDADFRAATAHAGDVLDGLVPVDELMRVDAFLREQARLALDSRYSEGEPWGARQEQLLGHALANGLDFSTSALPSFWDSIASGGEVSADQYEALPDGIAVSRRWIDRVKANAAEHGTTWMHELTLAIASLDAGDKTAALQHVSASLALKPSWSAYRLDALLADSVDRAVRSYLAAWNAGGAPPELAVEIATYLMAQQRSAELKAFVDALPEDVREKERIVLARAVVAGNDGQFDELERLLLGRQYASIREGETLLSDLWVRLRRGRLEADLGRVATAAEVKADLTAHPLPRQLDLRMHAVEES
jgi:hypothetical protein